MILDMPLKWTKAQGRDVRRSILAELLRRERESDPAASLRDLADVTQLSRMTMSRHTRALRESGHVEDTEAGLILTDKGREAARLIA